MTRRALGFQWGFLAASGDSDGAPVAFPSNSASAAAPNPSEPADRNCRRVALRIPSIRVTIVIVSSKSGSTLHHHFIQIQQNIADRGPGGQFRDIISSGKRTDRIADVFSSFL